MKVSKVLVAVDESEGAKKTLELAEALAGPNAEMQLDLVYVVPVPLFGESEAVNFKSIIDMMMSDGEDVLVKMKESMDETVAARTGALLLTGTSPAAEILKLIEQRDYEMVIIGSRGLSGFKEYIGSVSHKVLHGATIPVLIAK